MSIEIAFGNLFKPEVKSSGRKLVAQEKISLSNQSDTAIQAYVRVTPPFKVTLTTDDIASTSFAAECNCPVAKKSRFCKHIWATLLATEVECPDFLIGKLDIGQPHSSLAAPSPAQAKQDLYQESAKQRANDYRKEQYRKQKDRAKEKKREQKGLSKVTSLSSYTPEVEAALAYFELNGFPMPSGPSFEILSEAKRTLSRVFHPDKGGSHQESVELNQHCEVILQFLG